MTSVEAYAQRGPVQPVVKQQAGFTPWNPAKQGRSNSTGFTIIETLLFLSISALLMLVVVVGRGAVTRRAQFPDSLESLQSRLIQLQREQFSTVTAGTGKQENTIQFMTVVIFDSGSSEVRVRRCTTDRDGGPEGLGSYDVVRWHGGSEFNFNLKGDAPYACQQSNPGSQCADTVLFLRHHNTGDLKTIGLNSEVGQTVASALAASYDSTTPTMREIGINGADNALVAGVLINDSGSAADLGTNRGRINQIGKVFR